MLPHLKSRRFCVWFVYLQRGVPVAARGQGGTLLNPPSELAASSPCADLHITGCILDVVADALPNRTIPIKSPNAHCVHLLLAG